MVLAPEFPIIEDIPNWLLGAHGGGACSAIPRLVNGAAHALARHALALNFKRFWLEEIPYCISS